MGSMGVSIWPVHPSRICMDMPVRPWMFFFFVFFFSSSRFSPIRSNTRPELVRYGPKFLLKKNCIILDQNTPFCWLTLKENP